MIRRIGCLFFLICLSALTKAQEGNLQLIPAPRNWSMTSSLPDFQWKDGLEVFFSEGLEKEEAWARDYLETIESPEKNANIFVKVDQVYGSEDFYQLIVWPRKIIIKAGGNEGAFYGLQTLNQLRINYRGSIPSMEIEDEPRFKYRGMHLDVGRHFYDVEHVKKYIDLLAFHKFNFFHWHLTEDQGWRIEIKQYPKLTTVGSIRKGTAIGLAGSRNAPYTYDSIPYGGFYTQEEIREVVQYAADRHITIVPEIELPGHCLAALAAYPELGNETGPYEVAKRWGIFKEVFAPKDSTFTFIRDVLHEVMDLFPGPYVHIGGDEVKKDEWKSSQQAQNFMKSKGLKDEKELQSYFIQFAEKVVSEKGKSIIGWDEILEGGLAPNAVVMSWRGEEGGIEAAKQGHRVIMTPITHCYFDLYQVPEGKQGQEPLTGSKKHISVEKVYKYEPIPKGLSKEESQFILGAQGNVWTEYLPSWNLVEYRTLPRMTALSEVLWSKKEDKDWDSYRSRLNVLIKHWDGLNYNYAKHYQNW